jgi:hypothetical protein
VLFFWGVVGIFQDLFLPGLIFVYLLRYPKRHFEKFIAIIASSLVINYLLVFLLTACHIYIRPVVFILLIAEIGSIAWLYRFNLKQPIETFFSRLITQLGLLYAKGLRVFRKRDSESALAVCVRLLYVLFCLILAYIALNWIWKLFIWNLGSSFNSYDTVAEWNRWALDWAANQLPTGTWRYPQLLSSNWSLIYVLMGNTTIQFFAKSFMPLFTLFILLMMVDLAYQKRAPGYLLGTAISYLTLKKFLGGFLIEGLADMPAAFLAFAAVYLLILHQKERNEADSSRGTVLMAIIAAGAGVTKQVGVEFLGLYGLVFLLFYLLPQIRRDKRQGWKSLWISVGLVLLIVVPWYAYRQVLIGQGLENSEMGMIMDATTYTYRSADVALRFDAIRQNMGKYFYLFVLIIPFSFLMDPLTRGINFLIALPLFLSWGFLASYDFRNLSIALPILSMNSGLYIHLVMEKFFGIFKKIPFQRIRNWAAIALGVLLVFLMGYFFYPDELLYQRHSEAVMQTFSTTINQKLMDALKDESGDFVILTNYPLDYLPGMQNKKVATIFNDYDSYRYELSHKGVDYVLVPNYADQQILDDVHDRIQSGEFELVFQDDSWIPYEFVKVLPSK